MTVFHQLLFDDRNADDMFPAVTGFGRRGHVEQFGFQLQVGFRREAIGPDSNDFWMLLDELIRISSQTIN